jgi:acyl dehydratase
VPPTDKHGPTKPAAPTPVGPATTASPAATASDAAAASAATASAADSSTKSLGADFTVPADERYYEDYEPGSVYEYGHVGVTAAEIVEFAERFDPQPIHTDPVFAATGPFGGLIASGWHTCGIMMRLIADHYLSRVASLASPGVDELRWPAPLRPGDRLRLRMTVLDARPSRSKPTRGIVRTRAELLNQQDQLVLSLVATNILLRRPEHTPPPFP